MHLSDKQKRLLKWIGYPLLAIVVFIFTLHYTFPYGRLKDKIIEGLNDKYDVSIASIDPGLVPGTFTIRMMMLRTRPKTADEKPVTVLVDEINVNVGVMSTILWSMNLAKASVEVDARIAGGTLELDVTHDKGSNTLGFHAKTKMLPLASLPGVSDAVGLPMTGGLNAEVSLSLPSGKWSEADGKVELGCVGCTVGDGVAKMKMKPHTMNARQRRRAVFASEGLTVPRLNLGAVLGEVDIEKGVGTIKTLAAKSQDGFLNIEGKIEFKDPFSNSLFPGCMTFGFSDELKQREAKFMGIEAGLPPKAKQEDGSYAIPTKGKLTALRFDVRRSCGDPASSSGSGASPRRPRITTTPTEDKGNNTAPPPREMPELPAPKEDAKDEDAAKAEENAKKIEEARKAALENGPKLSAPASTTEDGRDVDEANEDKGGEDDADDADEGGEKGDEEGPASDSDQDGEDQPAEDE